MLYLLFGVFAGNFFVLSASHTLGPSRRTKGHQQKPKIQRPPSGDPSGDGVWRCWRKNSQKVMELAMGQAGSMSASVHDKLQQ
ncbi:uncharacterized protein BDZ83DRAFT_639209 [Colletotrichum acutatum]|uniref:Secreted protein n=1 Tax=Glomerella acutata TaxID=27357 RepID=A0AAD8X989_GLOAC|nr:uncharacterized protein BDZ83DRAFT_639209 [Colletotrichum acutatum]KAK1711875.1 hypothetical protein BDZ83DRAFT_639209 [Colletotrichum acutatum]